MFRSATDLNSGQGTQAAPRVGGSGSQAVVSQAETLDEISSPACSCIPSGVFRPFSSTRGNIDHSQRNVSGPGNRPTQERQRPSQAGTQIGACFLTIVEISMA